MNHDISNADRRQFLRAAAFAVSACSISSGLTDAACSAASFTKAKSSVTQNPVIGSGEFVYECIHNWDRAGLPADHHYGNASHGVAIDQQGLIYITHQGNPGSLFVFDPNGRFIRAMGEIHNQATAKGHGIDIRQEGSQQFLYLAPADSGMGFTKMTLDGEVVWMKDRAVINRESGGVLDDPQTGFRPTNTSFRPDGGYYLGDGYGSNFLFEYDQHDKFVRAIGGPGSDNGRFATPHGHWLDQRNGDPMLVVADRANKRLQWFAGDGRHVKNLEGFLFPADVDTQGDLMLVPDLHARITILNKENNVIAQLGDDAPWREKVLADNFAMRAKPEAWQAGRFVHPHDACFDAEGNIYVTEWVRTGRVTKLVRRV